MTARQHTLRRGAVTTGVALWRATRVLRAVHDEQVLMWDLFWQAGRVPADRAGPLARTPAWTGRG